MIGDMKNLKATARLYDSILRTVAEGPISANKLAKWTTSSSTRHRFEEALAFAVADGEVKVVDTPNGLGRLVQSARKGAKVGRREATPGWSAREGAKVGRREATPDDMKEPKAIARLHAAIVRKVAEGPISKSDLKKATTASSTRHRFDEALASAIADGMIEVVDSPNGRGHSVQSV